jgi:hypothetical protein
MNVLGQDGRVSVVPLLRTGHYIGGGVINRNVTPSNPSGWARGQLVPGSDRADGVAGAIDMRFMAGSGRLAGATEFVGETSSCNWWRGPRGSSRQRQVHVACCQSRSLLNRSLRGSERIRSRSLPSHLG